MWLGGGGQRSPRIILKCDLYVLGPWKRGRGSRKKLPLNGGISAKVIAGPGQWGGCSERTKLPWQ